MPALYNILKFEKQIQHAIYLQRHLNIGTSITQCFRSIMFDKSEFLPKDVVVELIEREICGTIFAIVTRILWVIIITDYIKK